MIATGMIYRYDETGGEGVLMLSDGEKKEFSYAQWKDENNEPAIGQKIAYLSDDVSISIRLATDTDIQEALAPKETPDGMQKSEQFSSTEECVQHYIDMGFKQTSDSTEEGTRSISLRYYAGGDYAEASIKVIASRIYITQTLNGEDVAL